MAKDTIDNQLDDILGIEKEIKQEVQVIPKKLPKVNDRGESIVNDYKYARENLYGLVERGQDAIDGILEVAKETEHPRAYEVAGQLLKTVGETAEKLLHIQKQIKDLEKDDDVKKVGTQHNHLYVGSTSELQKFLKNKNKE